MTPEFITAFAHGIADFYQQRELKKPILLGRDTRKSGELIEGWILSILQNRGIDVVTLGVAPTPALSFLLRDQDHALGIMITASHNPPTDNGIKLFRHDGFKMEPEKERLLEDRISYHQEHRAPNRSSRRGTLCHEPSLLTRYTDELRRSLTLSLSGRILIDCSHGSFSEIATKLFQGRDQFDLAHNQPTGENINLNCGALETGLLLERVRAGHYDYGVAFDGDGDRCVFVNRDYGVIETEKLLALLASQLGEDNASKTVVSTEICNKGLEKNLKDRGYSLVETTVGDRAVVQSVLSEKALVGAEPSGHYFFPKEQRSMDGGLAFLHFVRCIQNSKFLEELRELRHFPRVTRNIPLREGALINLDKIRKKIRREIDPEREKLVIRESMWDPILRVYYDYEGKNRFAELEGKILKEFA